MKEEDIELYGEYISTDATELKVPHASKPTPPDETEKELGVGPRPSINRHMLKKTSWTCVWFTGEARGRL